MKYKIVQGFDGILRNDGAFIQNAGVGYSPNWVEYLAWLAEGNTPEPADAATAIVPAVVSMRQARLALLQTDMLGSVNQAIAAADEATKITWEFSSEVQRNNPLVSTLAVALNLTNQQLDDLFTLAATL